MFKKTLWAFKEWKSSPIIAFFMVLHLAIGFSAVLSVEGVRTGIFKALGNQSRPMLGADLALSSRRPIENKELEQVEKNFAGEILNRVSIMELYSMIDTPTGSKLTQLAAIEPNYPFYGAIEFLKNKNKTASEILSSGSIIISTELKEQMQLSIGDTIKIGSQNFKVIDVIIEESANAIRGFSLAPRALLLKKDLLQTGLISKGTTAFYQELYKLSTPDEALENKYKTLALAIDDPAVRVVSHQKASEQLAQGLGYFQDYLGLVGLIAFSLALVATYFLFQTFLMRRRKTVAIYEVVGLQPFQQIQVLSLLFLFYLAAALLVTALLLPVLSYWIENQMSFWLKIPIQLNLNTWFSTRTIGSFVLLSVCTLCSVLPILIAEQKQSLLSLLQPHPLEVKNTKNKLQYVYTLSTYLPIIAIFFLTSIWITSSVRTGGLFTVLFLGSAFILFFSGRLILKLFEPLTWSNRLFNWANRSLTRQKTNTLVIFLSLALGVLLTTLVPEISLRMQSEFSPQTQSKLPAYFLFDILEEQHNDLVNFLSKLNIKPLAEAPWIRGRLLKINNENFEVKENLKNSSWQTREEEQQARMKNRGFNLTYRETITEDEIMLEGREFNGIYKGADPLEEPAEVSIETRFANQMGIQLNDVLTFDIQGMLINGKVVNIRKVRWTSFKPNFFVVLQPGILNDAPKTFLFALPNTPEHKTTLQNAIVKNFPNISIVDVNQVTTKISKLLNQISMVIIGYGWLVLSIGILVVFSVQYLQAETKVNEILLIRLSGLENWKVVVQQVFESFILIFLAVLLGTLVSTFIVEGVARFALQLVQKPFSLSNVLASLQYGKPIALQFAKIGIPSLLLVAWVYYRKTKIPLQNIIRE